MAPPTLNLEHADTAAEGVDIVAARQGACQRSTPFQTDSASGASTPASSFDVGNDGLTRQAHLNGFRLLAFAYPLCESARVTIGIEIGSNR